VSRKVCLNVDENGLRSGEAWLRPSAAGRHEAASGLVACSAAPPPSASHSAELAQHLLAVAAVPPGGPPASRDAPLAAFGPPRGRGPPRRGAEESRAAAAPHRVALCSKPRQSLSALGVRARAGQLPCLIAALRFPQLLHLPAARPHIHLAVRCRRAAVQPTHLDAPPRPRPRSDSTPLRSAFAAH
jgi:hypothetical protein